MAIRQTPKTDSTPAGIRVAEQARRDLISLSLAPIRQSLTVYADMQRSVFETFSRFNPWGTTILGASGERPQSTETGERNGLATAAQAKRPTATRTLTPAAKPAATKRPAATKPATTKRPAATKPATTKRPAATKSASTKRPAVAKRAATTKPTAGKRSVSRKQTNPKPPVKSAGRAKTAGKKVAARPSRPRTGRAGAAKKA